MEETGAAPRRLAVCVDDFGLHEGVNQAVLTLLALRRITAVSCLVDGPAWHKGAPTLQAAVGQGAQQHADVGLHLNFTEWLDPSAQSAGGVLPLGRFIRTCYLRGWRHADLVREIERQWRAFETVWGRAPDFVDGHQHVHQLPQVRDALFEVLARHRASLAAHFWVRCCRAPGWRAWFAGISLADTAKAAVIGALGAQALRRLAGQAGWRTSAHLLGVYPFDADAAGYLARWRAWLKLLGPSGDLIMCHPAVPCAEAPPWPDVIGPSRRMEHEVLSGPAFAQLLQQSGVHLARLT
jgi:predicted glycoside hydrolase/deacetylase ChbG (UPF0249 family)